MTGPRSSVTSSLFTRQQGDLLLTNNNEHCHSSEEGKRLFYGSGVTSNNNNDTVSDSSSENSSTLPISSTATAAPSLPPPPPHLTLHGKKRGSLSILQLAVLIFYSVSGGPFGIEESVRSAGPFYTIVGFLLGPLIFSVPECLITVELSSGGFQSSAACSAWVEEAFGKTAGFLGGFLSWVAGATDNAIYPVLFLSYALQLFPVAALTDGIWRFVFVTSISLGLAYLNWLGLDLVGNMSIGVCCIAMSPFVIFVIMGAAQVEPSRWFLLPTDFVHDAGSASAADSGIDDTLNLEGGFFPNIVLGGVMLRPLLNNVFWNYNSFDNAGSFAEDIQDPVRVLPRAMCIGFFMVVLGYVIPIMVALGTTDASPKEWVDGYLATVVTEAVGPWLGTWLVLAAAMSNLGMFQAELSSDAYMIMGMAERGHLPSIFATRSVNGTPTYALLLGTMVIVVMGVSDLAGLIEMLNFNYALALLLEYAAFIKLRISKPEVSRPCKIPLSTTGCVIALLPTFTTLIVVIALASYTTILVSLVITVVGTAVYTVVQIKNKRAVAELGYKALLMERNKEYTSL